MPSQTLEGLFRRVSGTFRLFHASSVRAEPKLNAVPPVKTRNIGIIAHIDAGKTTTTERMLFYSGKTLRIGNVDEGDTVTDYLPSERLRGITIQLAAISIPWNTHKINIIDTPGHADFTFEVSRSLRVLDGAVTILDAVAGVEAQTEKVWHQAAALNIPRIAYINKMDRPGAGFSRTVKEIVSKLQTRVVCVNLPYFENVNSEPVFKGVIDVIHNKLLLWEGGAGLDGTKISAKDIVENSELYKMVASSRESMVETLGEFDDSIIESFFEHDENYMAIPAAVLQASINKMTINNNITPVFCGLSFRNIGVQPLMDGVVRYLPSPLQIELPEVTSSISKINKKKKKSQKKASTTEDAIPMKMDPTKGLVINNNHNLTVALAFKVITHPARGVMTFFRVYSGQLASNSTVVNTRTGKKLNLRKIMLMHGDTPEEVNRIAAGNIGVVAGTEDDIITGDTLVSHGVTKGKHFSDLEANLKLHPIDIPPPLFNSSIEPATAGDARYMNDCIKMLLREDPSLHVSEDEDMGQTVLNGMGELHLEIIKDRLVNDMKANVRLRDVAVSYKETVARPDGTSATCDHFDNAEINAEVLFDSFEGEAGESYFADEEGAILLEQDNNILILEPGATPQYMLDAVQERRWKLDHTLQELQDSLIQGCITGLQMAGPRFGLPLHSCVLRIKSWNFPIDVKGPHSSALLDVGRRSVTKAVKELNEKSENNFGVLEPLMKTKVYVDSKLLGDVMHDLNNRCLATVLAVEDVGESLDKQNWALEEAEKIYLPPDYTMKQAHQDLTEKKVIIAETPLREMVGYLLKLRSMTQGRGVFDMSYIGMRRVLQQRLDAIRNQLLFI